MKLLQILPALILWTVVLTRIVGLRFGWKPGILTAMVLVATGTTLNIDAVYVSLDSWMGDRNILNLVVHAVLGLGMTELSRLIAAATGAPRTRWQALLVAGIALVAVQAVLLLTADTPNSATNFTDVFAGDLSIAWYQGLFFTWIGLITAYTGVECHRRNRSGETTSFRVGFDVIAASCFVGVLAVATKLMLVAQEATGVENGLADALYVGYRALIALTLVGFAVGLALPAYQRVREQSASRSRQRTALARLQPIVGRLLATEAGTRAGEAAALSMHHRSTKDQLYRWIIFIDDIRVENPGLLSPEELKLLDDIEASIAESGPAGIPVPLGS
ncbi:hypothetical protein [Arthrobacter sp. Rue61a]|uniref:hypothetical protein n=1 Tax=Arthrobacter sp. Rue61a TaxID=1118963 RepID=UPI00027DF4DD|nr:hypothetical protein [Arthrobacter sp. Rue61a]AFR31422.1 hypothetical protein ARUE_232p02140 [Arthrobacter sp. Rue61a]